MNTSYGTAELPKVPRRLVMVGGGYISFEFAHVAARTGAHVTIVSKGVRPLEPFDADLVDQVLPATRQLDITVLLSTSVRSITKRSGQLVVAVEAENGQTHDIETDAAVHGAGRVPDIDALDLQAGGVARNAKGIVVDEHLQSVSNAVVYAAGDAADSGVLPLTPVASLEGEIAVANLLQPKNRRVAHRGTPSVAFTTPALGAVVLLQSTARERGLAFRTMSGDTSGWCSSRRLAAMPSGYKILIEEKTDRVLGGHILGPGAEELINIIALGIQLDLPASKLREVVFAYPTAASDLSSIL